MLQAPDVTLLLVDDEDGVRSVVARFLTRRGWTVVEADNAEDGLRLAAGGTFAAIVSDLHLPGVTGGELIRKLREQNPGRPIVVITGDPECDAAREALGHGARRCLRKPFAFGELESAVREALAA
jgi:DNA-binding NtrC family response regulator